MANLTVCNRCKKPINGTLNDRRTKVHRVKVFDMEKDIKGEKAWWADLCFDCCADVEEFIEGKDYKESEEC